MNTQRNPSATGCVWHAGRRIADADAQVPLSHDAPWSPCHLRLAHGEQPVGLCDD